MSQDQQPVVFDAFGTLFDVSSLASLMSEYIPQAESVASAWRATQLQYSFIRTMTGAYADFDQVTRDALAKALDTAGIEASAETRNRLVQLWTQLPAYPETREMLDDFRDRPRAILSNGTFDTLTALLRATELDDRMEMVISADSVARFKPDPLVYAMVPAALGVPRESIHFVTANAFDVAGGKAAGFNVYWVNRAGMAFDTVGWEPDAIVRDLSGLPELIG